MLRFVLTFVCVTTALAVSACNQGTTPVEPAALAGDAPADLQPSLVLTESGFEGVVATFDVHVDIANMESEVTLGRSAQMPQAIYYDLDIENFLTDDTFRITGMALNENGDLRITYTHAHPFPAPDFESPITGLNRADLSYTGRLLVLAREQQFTYFNDEVTVDPGFMVNPDGYVQPGDLLLNGGFRQRHLPLQTFG